MKKFIFLIILVLTTLPIMADNVYYTEKEQAVIYGIRHGDKTILSTMTDEKLETLKAKLKKEQEQNLVSAISSGLQAGGQAIVESTNSFQRTLEKQEDDAYRQKTLEYERQQANAMQRQADALEKQNHYLKYGY
jgi:hypothetical protein